MDKYGIIYKIFDGREEYSFAETAAERDSAIKEAKEDSDIISIDFFRIYKDGDISGYKRVFNR